MDASVHVVQYYPVIRKYNNSKLRKKNKFVARTIISKEIARIVFYTLKYRTDYNNKFKGKDLLHTKSLQWPRITSPVAQLVLVDCAAGLGSNALASFISGTVPFSTTIILSLIVSPKRGLVAMLVID
jgi:hypothetical protein